MGGDALMNLFVASTEDRARVAIDTLGLDPQVWKPCGMGQALAGSAFDRIVVLWPHSPSIAVNAADWEFTNTVLATRLPRGRVVEIL